MALRPVLVVVMDSAREAPQRSARSMNVPHKVAETTLLISSGFYAKRLERLPSRRLFLHRPNVAKMATTCPRRPLEF